MSSSRDDSEVRTSDGRTLRVAQCGALDGSAVIYHHGWPSSRLLPGGHGEAAAERGIRLVSFDRAGYGGSSRAPGRTIGDVASDTTAIADALGIGSFGVWGVSGGGPHALACAALLPDRVVAAAVVAGIAPFDLPGLDFTAGMGEASQVEFALAPQGSAAYEPYVRDAAAAFLAGEAGHDGMESLLSPPDLALMQSGRYDEHMEASKHEALGGGIGGWLDDGLATVAPWGFDLASIHAPVLLLQGGRDLMVPPAHAHAMAAVLPRATLDYRSEEGHMTLGLAPEPPLEWLAQHVR